MSSPAASVLVERFDSYLLRRARSATVLTPGEAVTAAVGLLRGCRETADRAGGASWWLTAEGRPVPVADADAPDVVAATAETLARLGALSHDDETRDVVHRAREGVLTRPPREWQPLERRLFSHAAPVALTLGPLAPVEPTIEPATRPPGQSLSALVDADLVAMVRAAVDDIRDKWRGSPRWRALVVGVGLAAVVAIAAVVLLPTPDDDTPGLAVTATPRNDTDASNPAGVSGAGPSTHFTPAEHASGDPATSAPGSGGDGPRPAPSSSSADERVPLSDDVVEIARRLFAHIESCDGEDVCVRSHEEASSFTREPLAADASTAGISLLEDFGGVVVVRVDGATTAQYVTLVRRDDEWLVRAVGTIADQPS